MVDLLFEKIKNMSTRDRNKLRAEDLITLIISSDVADPNEMLNHSIEALNTTLLSIQSELRRNSDKIVELTISNALLSDVNKANQREIVELILKWIELNNT